MKAIDLARELFLVIKIIRQGPAFPGCSLEVLSYQNKMSHSNWLLDKVLAMSWQLSHTINCSGAVDDGTECSAAGKTTSSVAEPHTLQCPRTHSGMLDLADRHNQRFNFCSPPPLPSFLWFTVMLRFSVLFLVISISLGGSHIQVALL